MDQNETTTGTCLDCGQPTEWPSANRCAACAITILDSIWVEPDQDPQPPTNEETSKAENGHNARENAEPTGAPLAPTGTGNQHQENGHSLAQETNSSAAPDISANSETQQEPGPTKKPAKPQQTPTEKEPARLEDLPLFR